MDKTKIALIIVAAGSSVRMGGTTKKEYLPLNNGTVLSETARSFLSAVHFTSVTVVIPKDGKEQASRAFYADPEINNLLKCRSTTEINFVEGGATRQKSVYNALLFLEKSGKEKPDYVLIHDGARPFVSRQLILNAVSHAQKYGACVPGITPTDTQKEIDENNFIAKHLIRKNLCAVQTPQGFLFESILNAHKKTESDSIEYTDDSEIYDRYSGKKTFVFAGEPENKKITYKEDIIKNGGNKMIRTGIGYDKHLLKENRKLIIGGVEIPSDKGEYGHSDADATLHAIADALLGASHSGDIGSYFPDTDDQYKDADSKKLLSIIWNDVKKQGWTLENLDAVIMLERPKMLPYRNQIIASIAKILEVPEDRIFIKAKTGEKTGDVGTGKCIEVFATCLLSKQ
ncbi:MAG: 2-C-methyl-D-erythritol 2,4-cyclodiphosphate synthase [Treponema sp.]